MRIIAGQFRGRPLFPPNTPATRPITDRVKQSLFDILSPDIPDSVVLDCFAGPGSLGLECLSRGAAHVTFYESDRTALTALRRNIANLAVQNRSTVITQDIFLAPPPCLRASVPPCLPHLVFLDPPYRFLRERPADLIRLAQTLIPENSIVIFRHDSADSLDLPPLLRYDLRNYGSMTIELLKCPSTPTNISPPPTPPA